MSAPPNKAPLAAQAAAALVLLSLCVYSIILIVVELRTSQQFVRNFFTDIEGPVPFYAVNTSLSVFCLWATALLFVICIACVEESPHAARLRWLYGSQVLVFFFLGCDDRFKFHEAVAWRMGIADHFVLLAVAAVELGLLVLLAGTKRLQGRGVVCLGIACGLFAVMVVFDALLPHDMVLRLTLEDLSKTWASFFFLAFAGTFVLGHLQELKRLARRPVLDAGSSESTHSLAPTGRGVGPGSAHRMETPQRTVVTPLGPAIGGSRWDTVTQEREEPT